MSFLDNTGLTYFYNKIKERFIQSVSAGGELLTPDENGNVIVTNVATADNLTSPDAQGSYDSFIYRTSGGSASLESGEAELVYIDGNIVTTSRIEEDIYVTSNNNLSIDASIEVWKNAMDNPDSGDYLFEYTRATSGTSTTSWTASGTWTFDSSTITLSQYGLTVNNMVDPSVTVTMGYETTISANITPTTWFSKVKPSGSSEQVIDDGEHEFTYYVHDEEEDPLGEDGWLMDGGDTFVLLTTYGITISGVPVAGDTIIITSIYGTDNGQTYVHYTKFDPGHILVATPSTFEATGFNQFDKTRMVIAGASIVETETGWKIDEQEGTYIAYCRAVGGLKQGYVAYSNTNYDVEDANPLGHILNIGYCAALPSWDTEVTINTTGDNVTSTLATMTFEDNGYVVVAVDDVNKLAIHPQWSAGANLIYQDYAEPSAITLPTHGTLNGVDMELPLSKWGMPAVGNIADRLDLDGDAYIQRINRVTNTESNLNNVISLNTDYIYDEDYIYYVLLTPNIYDINISTTYTVNDFGTEEFTNTVVPVYAQTLYGQNLRDKLRTDVVTISPFPEPLDDDQKNTVCNNIGAVSRAGDTIFGNLTIAKENPFIYMKNLNMDTTASTLSNTAESRILFLDKNDKRAGRVYAVQTNTGQVEVGLQATNNSQNTNNGLYLYVDPNGTRSVSFSEVAPWRKALGLGTNGVLPITIAQGGTGSTKTGATSSKDNFLTHPSSTTFTTTQCAKWGKVCQLNLTFKVSKVISDSTQTLATLNTGYRPVYNATLRGHTGAVMAQVGTDGVISIRRAATSSDIAKNTSLNLRGTYLLAN